MCSGLYDSNPEFYQAKEEETDNSPRPLSEISEMSVEVGTFNKKRGKPISDKQRPLTRYLPIRGSDLDLRHHIETAGEAFFLEFLRHVYDMKYFRTPSSALSARDY